MANMTCSDVVLNAVDQLVRDFIAAPSALGLQQLKAISEVLHTLSTGVDRVIGAGEFGLIPPEGSVVQSFEGAQADIEEDCCGGCPEVPPKE